MLFKPSTYKYSELQILSNNPRFVDTSKIDFLKLTKENTNIRETITKTLEYEENFGEFLELIEQLTNGYNPALDQIFVLKNKSGTFVLEGNRRMIAINFLKDYKLCEQIMKTFITNQKISVEARKNCIEIMEISQKGPINDNFNEISVMEVNTENIKDNQDYSFIEKEIWSVIFTRHAGENKGKRGWTRAMYLVDLKNFYLSLKNKNLEHRDIIKEISFIFNKSVKTINLDIEHAIIVLKIFTFSSNDILSKENQIKYYKSISSLELSISTISIKLINGEEKTLKDICEIKVNKEKWDMSSSKIDMKKIAFFLIENVDKNYNTRGWKNDQYYILKEFISKNINDSLLKFVNYKTLKTYVTEAKKKNENERNNLEKEVIELEINLKTVSNEMNKNRSKEFLVDDFISISIKKLWFDNGVLLLDLFQEREKENFPFLLGATIIRSIEELISTFLFVYNKIWRNWIKEQNANTALFVECVDLPSTINIVKTTNERIFSAYKEKVRRLDIDTDQYSLICNSLSNRENWENKFEFLAETNNFDVWIKIISKFASEKSKQLNEIIHRYYAISDSEENLTKCYNMINNLITDISKLLNTLFTRN